MTAEACDRLHLLILAELDGELDAAEAATLLAHLAGCPGCAGLREEMALLSTRLRGGGLTRHAAPAALQASVAAQAAAVRPRRPWRGGSQAASFGAGLAVAAAAAWLVVLPAPRR